MTTVAVFGINGLLGKPVVEGLLTEPFITKIKTPIKLVTSSPEKKPVESDKVEYINYKNSSLKEAIKGVNVVINLGNVPNSPLQDVLDAVIANKVKLYIPSQFGVDVEAAGALFPGFLDIKKNHSAAAREAGIKTVDISTALFYDEEKGFVSSELPLTKVDTATNTVEFVGNENTKVNPSYYRDIGLATASIATFDDYSKLPNKVRIFSDYVTFGDLVAKYEKRHNVKLNTVYIDAEEFQKELEEDYKKNGVNFTRFGDYLKVFHAAGEGKGVIFETDHQKELVNPEESLFKWTKFPRE
jgi:uncharacterized protein YbjT (DUF2867 family)